jgi:flagellar protein FlaG
MGFSLTGAHVIFFVAAVIVAGAVSGIFIAITMDVSSSLSERGDRLQEQLDTDFKIINDPNNIPSSGGYYIFYLKNIGKNRLETSNETFQLFVDGEIIPIENYSFEKSFLPASNVTEIYVDTSKIPSGDRNLRVIGPIASEDEFAFKI